MLRLTIQIPESYDEANNLIYKERETILEIEHSLYAISKWEAKHKKPFLSKDDKTHEESLDYIKCMTLNKIDDIFYNYLGEKEFDEISKYIEDSQTATWFSSNDKERPSREIVTSEVIYSIMVMLQIPFECQYWHLNRLITLIRVINIKSKPAKKMSKSELLNRNRALNEARKKKMGSRG